MAMGYSDLGTYGQLHKHHDFPGSRRAASEKYGATHMLTAWEHEDSPLSPHRCRETRLRLQKEGQTEVMLAQGWDVEQFRTAFGINVLEQEELDAIAAALADRAENAALEDKFGLVIGFAAIDDAELPY